MHLAARGKGRFQGAENIAKIRRQQNNTTSVYYVPQPGLIRTSETSPPRGIDMFAKTMNYVLGLHGITP